MNKIFTEKGNKNKFVIDMNGISIIEKLEKGYIIVINKETGLWKIVDKADINVIWELCHRQFCFDEFKQKYPDKLNYLSILFYAGLLKINNCSLIKEYLYDKDNNHIQSFNPLYIVLKYTKKCNLSCAYCYTASDNNKILSMNNSMVVYIMKRLKDVYGDQEFTLCLHVGEPILRYKDIPDLIKELHKISKKITISLQSNATLITKRIAGLLKAEKIKVGISIDGFNIGTNSQRCYPCGNNSFTNANKGLDNLLNMGISPGLLCVINAFNQYKMLDYFDFYVKKGVKKFAFNFFFLQDGEKKSNTK